MRTRLHPVLLDGVHGPDGDVVEDAEARRPVCLGVMARRPDKGKGVAQLAFHDAVDGVQETSHGKLGDVVGFGGGLRVRIKVGMVLSCRLGDHLHVGALVDHLECDWAIIFT